MRIPTEIRNKFVEDTFGKGLPDVDTLIVFDGFDELEGSRVLEVGAHDEPMSNILADLGFSVTGVDFREYDKQLPTANYNYIRSDLCDLPIYFLNTNWGSFDSAISISAIEHFGLGTYGEGKTHPYYDILAMRVIYSLLRVGGSCYITIPFGPKFISDGTHWRIYDMESIQARLVQDFVIESLCTVVSGPGIVIDREYRIGEVIPLEVAMRYEGNSPHITIGLKMRKTYMRRVVANGR